MFERFDHLARLSVVLAHEEARLGGCGEIGADHLLLGVARADEAILAVAPERVRDAVVALRGPGGDVSPSGQMPFSGEAKGALDAGADESQRREHPEIRPGHLLLGLLAVGDTAARVLEAAGVPVSDAARGAEIAAAHPSPATTPPSFGGPLLRPVRVAALEEGRFEDAVREGHPVMVRLHDAAPLGDVGNPRVDARLLRVILAADGRLAGVLREHGVDEAAIDAALE